MSLIPYTQFDRTTGLVVKSGSLQAEHIPEETSQHAVLRGVVVRRSTHKLNPATLQPEELEVSHRQAWRSSLPPSEPTEDEVVLAALRSRLTAAELTAARLTLQRRSP
jgi:hypothetical protein